ncbi:hypothetical protein GOP47_0015732 [Adiantum capillus-veneris]|uniref:Uncharacterized protein n=1 Tax=Adiantum capillus-veneris TaxID=13818 RepID=A0A9D4ZE88_ADICA|nr:hypothetical protein GOP47_0015732 [Adiantum capillus-veneris]
MDLDTNMEQINAQSFSSDIKVTIDHIYSVVPAGPTPNEAFSLSNIDLTVMFPVETIYFYNAKHGKVYDRAHVDKIRGALSKLLVYYYPLAGRFKFNKDKDRMEVDCNAKGVLFVAASSMLSIKDLGEIGFVNPTFRALVLNPLALESPPIATIQVTTFKCGGFSFGMYTSHAAFDGLSSCNFLHNLAAMTRGDDIKIVPAFDRTCLNARDPPKIEYEHPEMMELPKEASSIFTKGDVDQGVQDLTKISSQHAYRSFPFSSLELRKIKEKAMEGADPCSTFEAMVSHVWQARVKATEQEGDGEQPVMVLFAVDIRKHVKPPLPNNFCGNGVITAYAQAIAREVRIQPLSFCVRKVKEGIKRVTSDYIKSAIDWLEVHKGIPSMGIHGTFYLSAWWKLPFHKVDSGWGEPIYAGPIMTGVVDMVLLISNCSPLDDGLNLLLALPPDQMANFEHHIHI